MRRVLLLSLPFILAGCDQTTQQASLDSPAAQQDLQGLPPIYNPLVDMHRKSPEKLANDLRECRQQAEPQERAARAAMASQQSGAALQAAGSIVGALPIPGISQARALTNTAQDIGAAHQTNAAITGANATGDYALVINTCLAHRGYTLLR